MGNPRERDVPSRLQEPFSLAGWRQAYLGRVLCFSLSFSVKCRVRTGVRLDHRETQFCCSCNGSLWELVRLPHPKAI